MILTLAFLIWLGLLIFWGGFWRADQRLPARLPEPAQWPSVAVVIPARDEAATIGAVLEAHAASLYPGEMEVFLVDDNSRDATAGIARRIAETAARPVMVVTAPVLEAGWTGKLWALHHGVAHAAEAMGQVRYILLTDADIRHAPDSLTRLVAQAEAGSLSLVSLMARLDTHGAWGRLLIPAFVFFFQKLYPFPLVNRVSSRVAGAAGGCVLIERRALDEIGGIAAIRGALIDDCTLAARIKAGPPRRRIWLGIADDEVVSLRDNSDLGAIWKMVSRTAFTQLGHSWVLLAGATLGMAMLYLSAPLTLIFSPLEGGGLALIVWGLMGLAYWPTARLYGQPWWWGVTLPLAAALYMTMTLNSAWRHLRGQGGAWKGRIYPNG